MSPKVISSILALLNSETQIIRFQNVLDKSVRRDDWTDTEDQIIQDTVAKQEKIDYVDLAKRLNRPLEVVS
jgi:hypothetical protein